jgi:hypothetical protein
MAKSDDGSQDAATERAYAPFAAARGLPSVSLPRRPTDAALARMARNEDDGGLAAQLRESCADVVVTLGQPAADVLADLLDVDRIVLRRDSSYGRERRLPVGRRVMVWLPLKHSGSVRRSGRSTTDAGRKVSLVRRLRTSEDVADHGRMSTPRRSPVGPRPAASARRPRPPAERPA